MSSKLLIFDLETTGLQHWRNAIHQLSAMVVINDTVVDQIDLRIRPHESAIIDPQALAASGVTLEQVMAYPHRTEQFNAFIAFLDKHVDKFNREDKFHLCGFRNASFDDDFIRNFFTLESANNFGSYFYHNTIDVSVLASQYLLPDRAKMPSFKLHRVAKWLGIEVDDGKLHDSMYDVWLTYEIYKIVRGRTIDDF